MMPARSFGRADDRRPSEPEPLRQRLVSDAGALAGGDLVRRSAVRTGLGVFGATLLGTLLVVPAFAGVQQAIEVVKDATVDLGVNGTLEAGDTIDYTFDVTNLDGFLTIDNTATAVATAPDTTTISQSDDHTQPLVTVLQDIPVLGAWGLLLLSVGVLLVGLWRLRG